MIKNTLRKFLVASNLPLTKNLKYDILTKKLFKKYLHQDSNCVDIGCHKGEILDEIIKRAKHGKHIAFEPIPDFYKLLNNKYSKNKNVTIYPFALADYNGTSSFNYVKNAPAYSGIKKRKYETASPEIKEITVETITLDSLNITDKIDLIKIDVEGGEYHVLKGAVNTIRKNKPMIIFEFGKGASDYYNVTPTMVYDFFTNISMSIFNLSDFFTQKKPVDVDKFTSIYEKNSDYIFLAM